MVSLRNLLSFVLVALLAASIDASAHAVVVESTLQDGAEVASAPATVELRFNVRIEQALSRASLKSASGMVPLAPRRGTSRQSNRLIVPLPALGAGAYELRYQVLAADGHTTQGVLRFRVQP